MHDCCALLAGDEAGARHLVFFHVKWLQPAVKGTLCVCVRGQNALYFGRTPEHEILCFSAARNRFLICVLQGAAVHVCCVRSSMRLLNLCCRSLWNGCINLTMFYWHVRREMPVSNVMLQNEHCNDCMDVAWVSLLEETRA